MPDRRALERRADLLWRLLVRLRDGGRCRRCGRPGTQAAHIYRRWNLRLRWMPANGLLVCDEHAVWSHDREAEFAAWAREQVGRGRSTGWGASTGGRSGPGSTWRRRSGNYNGASGPCRRA